MNKWIAGLEGLSDEPIKRSAQIALAAIDRWLSDMEPYHLDDAYDSLIEAFGRNET